MARKRGLTRHDVVTAAAAIANTGGLDSVTLAAVAAKLGVRSPSLYAHVDGLDSLRRRLALRAASEMATALEDAARGREGVDALRSLAWGYRNFAGASPGLYEAAQRAVHPGEDDELYDALARAALPVLTALAQAGVSPGDRVHVTRAFRSALHGFVQLERASGFGMPESVDESFDRLVELLLAGVRGWADASDY